MSVCGSSLFGPSAQYIKTNSGDLIAIEGSNTRERLILSDLRIPYKQIIKSRIVLKAGQVDYLLNHLGLGDNATFIAIKAVYNKKSVLETNNYINWSYYNNLSNIHSFSTIMVLSGNSTNRVEQIYLTNPNTNYDVQIEVMVAVIDDNYSFFNDIITQNATTFTGLEYTDIDSYVIGESIVIYDKSTPARPLIFLTIDDIILIQREGSILTVISSSKTVFLKFLTEGDAAESQSRITSVMENPSIDIGTFTLDNIDPILYFFSKVGGVNGTGSYINFNGSTSSVPYNTSYGLTFSTSINLGIYGSNSLIDKSLLLDLLVDKVIDNRDGTMSIISDNLSLSVITATQSAEFNTISAISATGSYKMTFNFSDIALNYLDGVIINIDIF